VAIVDYWIQPSIGAEPQPGEQAWVAGRVNEVAYSEKVGRVVGEENGVLTVTGLPLERGLSGSPVVSPRGIIGMIDNTGHQGIISITQIKEVAEAASLPWQLVDTIFPPALPTQVCITQSGQGSRIKSLRGLFGPVPLDGNGCANTTVGEYRLQLADGITTCDPMQFKLTRQAKQTIGVTCSISPVGIWQSATAGNLLVRPDGENRWQVSGMDLLSNHGIFQGTLIGVPPALSLDVLANDGTHLMGPLSLESRSLKGRIMLEGTPTSIEFIR
jgi:hypothetical protein